MCFWKNIIVAISLGSSALAFSAEESFPDESVFHLTGSWQNADGQKLTLSSLSGKTLVVAMIYTSCQFSCPLIVQEMERVRIQVKDAPADAVRYVLISMDPVRDTPTVLQTFAKKRKLDPLQWLLLTASTEDQIREFSTVIGVSYKKAGEDFAHSNLITVIDRDGVIRFSKPTLGQQVVETAQAVVRSIKPK
ncbi:MAG: SCO family protein [Oligoflexales bacterium]